MSQEVGKVLGTMDAEPLGYWVPDTGMRSEGVNAYCWSIEEFCRQHYLRFLFADADAEASQLSATVDRIEAQLLGVDVRGLATFSDVVDLITSNIDAWAAIAAPGTRGAFLRRLEAAAYRVGLTKEGSFR